MSGRAKVFGHLLTEVVRKQRCVSCGSCEASCPVGSITLKDGTPNLVGLCIACGICYNSCPRSVFDDAEIEKRVFGRSRSQEESDLGIVRSCFAVRTTSEDIRKSCQDGGAVTSVLAQFITDGGDCAVVADLEEGKVWVPKPAVAFNRDDLLKAAGTKYTSCPILVGVDSAVKEYQREKIAVVGTPCQMRALRRIEAGVSTNVRISDAVSFKVGLFCMETFNHDDLMKFLESEGVDASKVTKFMIKRGKFIANQGEETLYEVRLARVKEFVRPCCEECTDFSSEFSDVSVGNVGSPDGWSTVLTRTEIGEAALKAANDAGLIEVMPLDEGKAGLGAVIKLAQSKRKKEEKAAEQ